MVSTKYVVKIINLNSFVHNLILAALEPVKFIGEGEYNLNVLKEIEVTDSYLGLEQEVRGCQNKESLHDCTTKHYIDDLKKHCGCIPFSIRMPNDLTPMCSPNENECVNKIQNETSNCLSPCSGLTVTSFSETEQMKNAENLITPEDIAAYNEYMKWVSLPAKLKG